MHFIQETFTLHRPTSDKKRIGWIDLAKGICIFLVVYNHIFFYPCVFLEQLRMPIYFVLSGLFFKDYGSFRDFAIRKTNKILIPFVFFYLFSQLFRWVVRCLRGLSDLYPYPDFLGLFRDEYWFNNPLWFLLCLYEINLLYYLIQCYFPNWKWRLCAIAVAGLLGAALAHLHLRLPLYWDAVLSALPFFYLGTILKTTFVLLYDEHTTLQACMGCAMIAVLLILPTFIPVSSIKFVVNDVRGSYFVALLCSALGVISLLLICKRLKWLPFFSFIGRYSIIVLCAHQLYIEIVGNICSNVHVHYQGLCELVIVSALSWITIPIAVKIIPWFVAQKDLIRIKS